jgi:hypothetical protein
MRQPVEETSRDAILVEDAHVRPMMGFEILEPLPARSVPYERVDPFILVHEARFRLSELQDVDTKHPHRGFDNLWYILPGSASTGHSTEQRSSGLDCPRARSWRSGPGVARGTRRRSARSGATRAWATPSGGACCSG